MPLLPNPNAFANSPLDRAGHRRRDAAWLAEALAGGAVVPFHKGRPFLLQSRGASVSREVGWMGGHTVDHFGEPNPLTLFLGVDDRGEARFAVSLSEARDPSELPIADLGQFEDLRAAAAELPPAEAAILAGAKALFEWHARALYCGACGGETRTRDGGWKRQCARCDAEHFPRLDPVVIMLAVRGDVCCLGRQARFPEGMFSALAGFVEPGESLEEACARELFEEAGLKARSVRYVSTQPWPFPHSLMIGLIAEVEEGDLVLDADEIVDAVWLTRAEAAQALSGRLTKDGRRIWAPPPLAIAHQLLKTWAAEG